MSVPGWAQLRDWWVRRAVRRHHQRHKAWLKKHGTVNSDPSPGSVVHNWRGHHH